jgi:23S rRNA (adenine2030-N6)-methyltransferase
MNYRHQFHAGNFADVVKHVLLVRLMKALQREPKGFLFLDTHAGRGAYDLAAAAAGDSLARKPEWPDGIGRLWSRQDLPQGVAEYVTLVRDFDRERGNLEASVRFYPGSPWIARRLAREQDRTAFCEMHPAEYGALRSEFLHLPKGAGGRAMVQEMDGYVAVRAMLPPTERRALVLIDPPYEAQDEFASAATAVAEGLQRLPAGVFALWYPLTERARVQEFFSAIEALRPPPTLAAELSIADDLSALRKKGCGLLVINPPWQFADEAADLLGYLAPVLAQERGAGSRITWLVPEK